MRHPRILVVDDDPAIIRFVRANLRADHYDVLTALDGAEALEVVEREMPDLIILDIMLPRVDGAEVCRRLREWCQIPIIMLSARGDAEDKVRCLELGADDYLSKPFSVEELLSRLRAVLRRMTPEAAPGQAIIRNGELEINLVQRRVTLGNQELDLTGTEYKLLSYLTTNAGMYGGRSLSVTAKFCAPLWPGYGASSKMMLRNHGSSPPEEASGTCF